MHVLVLGILQLVLPVPVERCPAGHRVQGPGIRARHQQRHKRRVAAADGRLWREPAGVAPERLRDQRVAAGQGLLLARAVLDADPVVAERVTPPLPLSPALRQARRQQPVVAR